MSNVGMFTNCSYFVNPLFWYNNYFHWLEHYVVYFLFILHHFINKGRRNGRDLSLAP